MTLRSIIPQSIFGSIATITGEASLEKAYGFMQHAREFIQCFQNVIIALNKTPECEMSIVSVYKELWQEIAPNAVFLYNRVNSGYMFGTIELEESILSYIKVNFPETTYLFKSSEDMLLSTKLLDIEYEPADFYFLPGFSYESIQNGGGIDNYFSKMQTFAYPNWTPQTTFYILKIDGLKNIYGNTVECKRSLYLNVKNTHPNVKPWEIQYEDGIKFDCESLLAQTVLNLGKRCLISVCSLKNLLRFVSQNRIADPSHKNLLLTEISTCHYHFWTDEVYEI